MQTVKETQGHLTSEISSYVKKNNVSVRARRVYLILARLTDRSAWEKVNATQTHRRLRMCLKTERVSNASRNTD